MYILGIMSGTSLDGIDFALCSFSENRNITSFEIHKTESLEYCSKWRNRLTSCHNLSAIDLLLLHKEYGFYLGTEINKFIEKYNLQPNYIASHGHTVFHQPKKSLTFQLGDGAAITAICGIPVISDFRNTDVCLGGQGAPLVPVGDKELFSDFDYCLNLGGFANISFEENNIRKAFDICPVNIVLNKYAKILGAEFDNNGDFGRQGIPNFSLVDELDNIEFYNLDSPKSLSREWLDKSFISILNNHNLSTKDLMASIYEHVSNQLVNVMNEKAKKVLITGGGAFNSFLIELFAKKTNCSLIIPSQEIINFKEALIFAFLGYLYINDKPNCFSSVTGAKKDSIGGCLYK